nr:MAG TPA: hypothetical protein [Caudoviricetes sp.]
MIYIDSDLKSYTKRENRAEWLNKLIDYTKMAAFGTLAMATFYLAICVAALYDMPL